MKHLFGYILLFMFLAMEIPPARAAESTSIFIGETRPWPGPRVADSLAAIRGDLVSQATVLALITIGHQQWADYLYSPADSNLEVLLDSALARDSLGGTVLLLGGDYVIGDSAFVPAGGSGEIVLRGEEGRTKIFFAGFAGYAINDTAGRGRITFRDLVFAGDTLARGVFSGAAAGCDSVSFIDCEIKDFTSSSSTLFKGHSTSKGWRWDRCSFFGNYTFSFGGKCSAVRDCRSYGHSQDGFCFSAADSISVVGCEIKFPGRYGIYLYNSSDGGFSEVANNQVVFEDSSSAQKGVYLNGQAYSIVQGNRLLGKVAWSTGEAGRGIEINNNNTIVQNNYLELFETGIYVTGGTNLIQGNHVDNTTSTDTGIYFNGGINAAIGNFLYGTTTGINVASGTKNCLTENFFLVVSTNVSDSGTGTIINNRDLD